MRTNDPESPAKQIPCFIDPAEWDVANWGATVFAYDYPNAMSQELPGIGIGFQNFEAGKSIFDGWIKRLGQVDLHEELRVSIIEGAIPSDPDGYTVLISSNPANTLKRMQLADPNLQHGTWARCSRLTRMYPGPGAPHLRLFKTHFARVGRYRLFPAQIEGVEIKAVDSRRYIEKRELNLFRSSDLKPKDLEYAAFTARH